ncbi:Phospholipid-metabolizing enzyme A-C1 [Merluccius polli]|uniref:Phospholipid-metabolizing enzyme A-C1 n=1 Tax=Merluccius polli TaxID=89951 RepID=A0AA47M9I2_MERPO|nr:Phospholipid-metabolizing enzyme A-C1 [Merluccius polli]
MLLFHSQFQFGDVIAIPRELCDCFPSNYTHYAVWVGDVNFTGKKPGANIFEHKRPSLFSKLNVTGCVFNELNTTEKYKKHNYLDGIGSYVVGTPEEMKKRIIEQHKTCPTYYLFSNNCEHLATYIRYGTGISVQMDTFAAPFCKNKGLDPELKKMLDSGKTCKEWCKAFFSRRG